MGDRIIEGVRTRDFAEWLGELDYGSVNDRLSAKLLEVSSAVQETNKKGTITIKITIEREGDMAIATADIDVKKPEHPLHGSLFFWDKNGSMHRDNPNQLKLRELEKPAMRPVPATPASASVKKDDDDKEGA